MSWRRNVTQALGEWLRFTAAAGWLLIGVLCAAFCVWFAFRFLIFFAKWLDGTVFSEPW